MQKVGGEPRPDKRRAVGLGLAPATDAHAMMRVREAMHVREHECELVRSLELDVVDARLEAMRWRQRLGEHQVAGGEMQTDAVLERRVRLVVNVDCDVVLAHQLVEIVRESKRIDTILLIGSLANEATAKTRADELAAVTDSTEQPIILSTYTTATEGAMAAFAAAGIPCYTSMPSCARAIRRRWTRPPRSSRSRMWKANPIHKSA